jgi:hypothetical protein
LSWNLDRKVVNLRYFQNQLMSENIVLESAIKSERCRKDDSSHLHTSESCLLQQMIAEMLLHSHQ